MLVRFPLFFLLSDKPHLFIEVGFLICIAALSMVLHSPCVIPAS